jgi:4-hydroxybenzoate polyprenyltransferase
LWIGGFDLIYALQDLDSDRAGGVYSLPARFGPVVALRVSEASHLVTLGLFVAYGVAIGAGVLWFVGVALVAVAFTYEHSIVGPDDLSRVNRAFFTTNGFVGIALFVFGLADLLVRGLGA